MIQRLSITLGFVLLLPLCIRAQHAAQDALFLSAHLVGSDGKFIVNDPGGEKSDDWKECWDKLNRYLPDPKSQKSVESVVRQYMKYDTNQPIRSFFPDFVGESDSQTSFASGGRSLASGLGSVDVTQFADGFAKFLVERTRQELSTAFFERFVDLLEDPAYKDARTLFPRTHEALRSIGQNVYLFSAYLNVLRESFVSDLSTLIDRLPLVVRDPRYDEFFQQHRGLRAVLLTALELGAGFHSKTHPAIILEKFDVSNLSDVENQDIAAGVRTMQVLSESMRGSGGTEYWIERSELNRLLKDRTAFKIYLGLVWQRSDGIRFAQGETMQRLLEDAARTSTAAETWIEYLRGMGEIVRAVENNVERSSDTDSRTVKLNAYLALSGSVVNLLEYSEKMFSLPILKQRTGGIIPKEYAAFITYLRDAVQLAQAIDRGSYGAAILHLHSLYTTAFTLDPTDPEQVQDTLKKSRCIQSFLMQYGTFMAAVAEAKNSDDVQRAIEAAALPPGSASMKRHALFDVSLNAYLGPFTGMEWRPKTETAGKFNTWGITAPAGLSFSTSCRAGSFSLFVSLIDLGAVTAYRFGDDTTQSIPTVQLRDIVSPGLFLSYGIPSLPISVHAGIQVSPPLHKVTSLANEYRTDHALRVSLGLVVDIPVLSFYNKPRME
ncbi:MAG: hypothetical protein HY962_08205 [Ignavibacteriae bacterium]|nr:hypothetical protein [Ignavibacteriota bacterium]